MPLVGIPRIIQRTILKENLESKLQLPSTSTRLNAIQRTILKENLESKLQLPSSSNSHI